MGKNNKKLTIEEVIKIANNLGYDVLDDEYINIKTLMNFKCKECGHVRCTSFDNLKRKIKCSNCNKKVPIKASNKGRFLWTEENIEQWITDNASVKIINMEYDGIHSWLILECLDCGKQFRRKFENFKVNPTCPQCRDNPRRFTYKQIKDYIEIESNSGCKLLETEESYKKKWLEQPRMALCKIRFKCKCDNEFEQSFNGFKSGEKQECNECSMGRKTIGRSYEEIKNFIEVESNSGLKLLSTEYKDNHTPLYLRCSCGEEFYRCFAEIKGTPSRKPLYKCKTCTGATIQKTTEQVKEDFFNHGITLLSEYINYNSPIKVKYSCGFEVDRTYANVIKSKYKCPHCLRIGYGRDTEQLRNEIEDVTNGEYSLLSEYETMNDKVIIKHNKCSHIYEITPHNFLDSGNRCPKCGNYKGEIETERILKQFNMNYIDQYSFDELIGFKGGLLRFDFAIFNKLNELLFLCEYDGEFHYKKIYPDHDFEGQVARDNLKNEYCKQNNIDLLRIPYWDFENIEEIITNKLKKKGLI